MLKDRMLFLTTLIGGIILGLFFLTTKALISYKYPLTTIPEYETIKILYWIGFILLIIPIAIKCDKKVKIAALTIIILFTTLNYALIAPYGRTYGRDSIYNLQNTENLIENKYWEKGEGTGYAKAYSYFPGLAILNANISLLTNINIDTTFLYFHNFIRALLIPLLLYLIFKPFVKKEYMVLAIFLYFTSPSLKTHIHQEGIGIIFLLLTLYLVINAEKNYTNIILAAVISLLTFFSHHFSSYVLIGWIVFLCSALFIKNLIKKDTTNSLKYVLFMLFIIISLLFIPTSIDRNLAVHTLELANLTNWLDFSNTKTLDQNYIGIDLTPFDISMVLISALIVLATITIGLIYKKQNLFLTISFLYCSLITLFSMTFIPTEGLYIFLRIFEFAYIGFIPFMVIGFEKIEKHQYLKYLLPALLVILFIGGNVLIDGGQARYLFTDKELLTNDNFIHETPAIYSASQFMSSREGGIIGDKLIYNIFGGFQNKKVYIEKDNQLRKVFGPSDKIKYQDLNYLASQQIYYIVPNTYQDKTTNTYSEEISFEKLENSYYLQKIYSNQDVQIYEIRDQELKCCLPYN